jgi:PBSX family phage terminase large subunit
MNAPAREHLRGMPRATLQALRAELGPGFVNEQQRAFFDSQAPEVLYSGAFRAGKSRIGCEKAYYLARTYPGIPIGIFRKTAASLPASTERTLLVDVIPVGAIVRSNATQHWYELANGSRIWLFGLDPDPITGVPSKVGSVELGWAFVDEAAECSEGDWVMVKGRLSWPGIPYHQITAATNPAGPAHWLKARFTPQSPSRVYLHASTFENPTLAADYIAEAQASPDDYFHRRYHLGEWVAAEGGIWFIPDDQIAEPEQTEWKRVVAGVDWGFRHAFACEVVGESGSGRRATLAEVYGRGLTIENVIPALKALHARYHCTFYADPSEPAYIEQCRRAGLAMVKANNDVLAGITAVTDALAAGMTVSPTCTGLLGEVPAYVWKQERGSGEMADSPLKSNDDACDAWRYANIALSIDTEPGFILYCRSETARMRARRLGTQTQ